MTDPTTLPVAEIFGPTFQGEGPHTGRRCWFVRLGDCNLHCSWCDTKQTWDWTTHDRDTELTNLPVPTIHRYLYDLGARTRSNGDQSDMIVLTGGEPLIHYHDPAFRHLLALPYRWHLESNGTIWPGIDVATRLEHVSLSVKIAQDDDPEKRRIKPKAIKQWLSLSDGAHSSSLTPPVAWKFVVRDGYDVAVVEDLVNTHRIPRRDVWCMAEGTEPMPLLNHQAVVADSVLAAGFNLSTRLHVLAWPDQHRGR